LKKEKTLKNNKKKKISQTRELASSLSHPVRKMKMKMKMNQTFENNTLLQNKIRKKIK